MADHGRSGPQRRCDYPQQDRTQTCFQIFNCPSTPRPAAQLKVEVAPGAEQDRLHVRLLRRGGCQQRPFTEIGQTMGDNKGIMQRSSSRKGRRGSPGSATAPPTRSCSPECCRPRRRLPRRRARRQERGADKNLARAASARSRQRVEATNVASCTKSRRRIEWCSNSNSACRAELRRSR